MYYLTFTLRNGITDTIPYRSLVSAKRAIRFYESNGAKVELEYKP